MRKYLKVFEISLKQELVYRLNFIMWRVRNITQIFLIFFLWDSVFADPSKSLFGYDRAKILTYVFGILLVKAVVYSGRSTDIPGEIARGDLSNYLLRPVSYFKFWFTRDLSSKLLNFGFAVVEAVVLFLILRPPFYFQQDAVILIQFLLSLVIAIGLYFCIVFLFSLIPFWYPEQAWGSMFIFMIFSEFMGGGMFPLDIFPSTIQRIIYATPFPYILFVPLQIYLGKYSSIFSWAALGIGIFWIVLLTLCIKFIWKKGLRVYRAEGR